MNRKDFLRKGILGTAIFATSGVAAKLIQNNIDEIKELDILGFNHLPNKDSKIMENKVNEELEKAFQNKFLTPSKFALEIEHIVMQENCNYIDAIVLFCENNNLEVDSVSKLISKPLKEKLKNDAVNLNFIKKTSKAKLPL